MDRMLKDADGIARACRTLGLNPTMFETMDALTAAVLARGRERAGCAGLAELIAARLCQIDPDYARSMQERWRRHEAN
jgi:hypothetical protein